MNKNINFFKPIISLYLKISKKAIVKRDERDMERKGKQAHLSWISFYKMICL